MKKSELDENVNKTINNGKAALELVKSTIAPGQWKQLWKNAEFARLCGIFGVEE